MLLVANLVNTKGYKKFFTRRMGIYLKVLSDSYLITTNTTGFR